MGWSHPDHKASAVEAIARGVIRGDVDVLGEVPEPQQSSEHQARVSSLSILNELGGPDAVVQEPWAPPLPPVEPPVEPPVGDVVVIPSGIHMNFTVRALPGVTYMGEPGAVLDGGGTVEYAFYGDADDVTIDGCEIRNYNNPAQRGAISARGVDRWTVSNNEIHHNWGAGVQLRGDGHRLVGNNIHHQHQLGVSMRGDDNLVEGNEIAYNNYEVDYSWGWEAGGTKFWDTNGLIVRNNWAHHNHGPGLWDDYNNINILYEDNLVEDNYGPGIYHEIGYDAVIRNNTVLRNGTGGSVWLWYAGILISASRDTEVYGNTLVGNFNGIGLVQQNRVPGSNYIAEYGPWLVEDNYIHDNVVEDSGLSGAVRDTASDAIYHSNNVFENNTYSGSSRWTWGGIVSWDEWVQIHPGEA